MSDEVVGLTVIGASAGTGKTHRLTEIVWQACRGSKDEPAIAAEALVAVTFTEKAAAELADRLRTRLFGEGAPEAAHRLTLAWLGTVHSVGKRLVERHAFEAGLSPDLRVWPDDGGVLLRALLERAVPVERQARLEMLGARLEVHWDQREKRSKWTDDVFRIVQAARANRIRPDDLAAMALRSWEGISGSFPPGDLHHDLDAQLAAAARPVIAAGPTLGDIGDNTGSAFATLAGATERIALGHAPWSDWLRLASLRPGVKSQALVAGVIAIAQRHIMHARFHAELEEFIALMFAAAADVLRAFKDWKATQRVLDWNDMLDQALDVLESPRIAADVVDTLRMVVVDELQDSGPLQLALFAKLHALVKRSFWVGDPKQCIFEWNGADPGLMDALLTDVRKGGSYQTLTVNYRSRPALVRACSALFASAFASVAMPAEEVMCTASERRSDEPAALAKLEPFGVGFLDAQGGADEQLAQMIAGLLADSDATPVENRHTGDVRGVSAGDIAVLLLTNAECVSVAEALRGKGIAATVASLGLMQTPEGRAVVAGLRLLLAREDTLAEAELEALDGFRRFGPVAEQARGAWLDAALSGLGGVGVRWTERLQATRDDLPALSVSGAFERLIEALDLPGATLRWGNDGEQRRSNLDALRALVRGYEAEAAASGAATIAGLLRYVGGRGAERAAQHTTGDGNAVTLTTYHRAKGLEWPVVILGSLGSKPKRQAFEVWPESERLPTLADPLGGRWIRYWPWPYGGMKSGALKQAVEQSDVGKGVVERERRERLRLLYVGFTRARDHLILAIPRKKDGTWAANWLEELETDRKKRLLSLPVSGTGVVCAAGPNGIEKATCRLIKRRLVIQARPAIRAFVRPVESATRAPRYIAPSRAETATAAWQAGGVHNLGGRLVANVRDDEASARVGMALHGFLATDDRKVDPVERTRRARGWLAETADAESLVAAADRFWNWVGTRWPGAKVRCEVPLHWRFGEGDTVRIMGGAIDLLLETDDAWIVIDHKTGGGNTPAASALEHAAQLGAYHRALIAQPTRGERRVELWLHFMLAGVMTELVSAPLAN